MSISLTPSEEDQVRLARRQKRARRQMLFVCLFLLTLWSALRVARFQREKQQAQFAALLNGTWELEAVGHRSVGRISETDVQAQTLTFANGIVRGETRIVADSPSGTTAIPFPDESVRQTVITADNRTLLVQWDGTYQIFSGWRIALQIGKSAQTLLAQWDDRQKRLTLERDFLLTWEGPFLYHRQDAPAPATPPKKQP